ncbi:MAG: hypothetical protein ABW067_07520 [Rhizobacter sp.]
MARPEFNWKLPPEITQRLGQDSYGAQRTIFEGDHLLVVLHEPPVNEGNEREHRVFLRSPDGAWRFQGAEHGQHMMADLLTRYETLLGQAEQQYAQAETADELFPLLDRLLPTSRAAVNLRDTLQQARDHVKDDRLVITWRDRAVDAARGFELLLANARLALDYRLAKQAEAQTQAALAGTRAQLKLNTLAALTFPLMAVAAVFGMNLHHGLENQAGWLFWAVFGAGLAVGLVVKSWVRGAPPAPPVKPAAARSVSGKKAGNRARKPA